MNNVNLFDGKSKEWDKNLKRIKRTEKFIDKINEVIEFDSKQIILDYGCGTGNLGIEFSKKVKKVYFLDGSIGMLDVLSKKLREENIDNIEIINALNPDIHYFEEPVDIIITAMVLHHVKDLKTLIDGFISILSEKGKIIIFDLDEEDGSFHEKDFDGHYGIKREFLKRLFLEKGIEKIKFFDVLSEKKIRNGVEKEYSIFLCFVQK